MVNDWTRRYGLFLLLPCAGFLLLSLPFPVLATRLHDIRVGEYDGFTRIVFEFDAQAAIESIGKGPTGKLTIAFPEVRPEFIRKIPVNPNANLTDIQIEQRRRRLAVIFTFKDTSLQFDSFQLTSPPRLVIDVHRATAGLPLSLPGRTDAAAPITPTAGLKESPLPLARLSGRSSALPSFPALAESNANGAVANITPTAAVPPLLPETVIDVVQSPAPISAVIADGHFRKQRGLQYYLLVALVVLTIAILILLIIMLFSRHKWSHSNGKQRAELDDMWHRQDEHIASINSQIEEQLKRYREI